MKHILDKLKDKAKLNKRFILFFAGISLIGLISGSIFMTILSKQDQTLVKNYVENFMSGVNQNKLNYLVALQNTVTSHGAITSIIWLLGISIIGIPIVIFFYFTKSFMIGFSVASFVLQYHAKGILYAIVYIFPHHLLNIIAYTALAIYSVKFSLYLLDSLIHKKTIHLKNIVNQYLGILMIVVITFIITSLYETFAVPYFLKQIGALLH